jgi:rSAM/selenodomain-associated transferase 2
LGVERRPLNQDSEIPPVNAPNPPSLSIIIPAVNEAHNFERFLNALSSFRSRGAEIIVVDGGSDDGTREIAAPLADRITTAPRGRAAQMNAGAALARADVLLFLHADSLLPKDADTHILWALARTKRVWGRFDIRIDSPHPILLIVAMMINFRTRLTGIATGDQAIFVRRAAFRAAGGYKDIPLMEDIALSKALRAKSRPISIAAKVVTSARRWHQYGIFRTIFLMWRLRLAYFFGADPHKLASLYEGEKRGS